MDRRDVILKSSGMILTTALAGCTYSKSGSVSLAMMNRAGDSLTLELEFLQGDEIVYSEFYELEHNDEISDEDIIAGGSYDIRASIDGNTPHYHRLEMNGCDEQVLVVGLNGGGNIDFDTRIC